MKSLNANRIIEVTKYLTRPKANFLQPSSAQFAVSRRRAKGQPGASRDKPAALHLQSCCERVAEADKQILLPDVFHRPERLHNHVRQDLRTTNAAPLGDFFPPALVADYPSAATQDSRAHHASARS